DQGNGTAAEEHGEEQGTALAAEDDPLHAGAEAMGDHQRHVPDEEEGEGQEAQEVDAPCHLVSAEESRQPREARGKRRRHRETGGDLKRAPPEDEKEVRELLECVVTVSAGWEVQARGRR